MKWPNVLMLLLVLLAPTSSLAATLYCCADSATADSCCEPEGACSESREGECVLASAGDVFKLALPSAATVGVDACSPVTLATGPIVVVRQLHHAREPARIPRYLRFQSLRN